MKTPAGKFGNAISVLETSILPGEGPGETKFYVPGIGVVRGHTKGETFALLSSSLFLSRGPPGASTSPPPFHDEPPDGPTRARAIRPRRRPRLLSYGCTARCTRLGRRLGDGGRPRDVQEVDGRRAESVPWPAPPAMSRTRL